ncbi:MAG TPA: GWxTD domain-containing protein [Ignavibacteriaceae bacterium]|nr:GWxTD domain-containing protein [Ignavibacteriaceae bacterium]
MKKLLDIKKLVFRKQAMVFKMRFFLILIFLFNIFGFSQHMHDNPAMPRGVFVETHMSREKEGKLLYISFRLSNNTLVFRKAGEGFSGEYSVSAEVSDSSGRVLVRESIIKEVFAATFEESNSTKFFSQGVMRMSFPFEKSRAIIKFNDLNTKREFILPVQNWDSVSDEFLKPVVVTESPDGFELVNFGGRILFTSNKQTILFPLDDTSKSMLQIKIRERKNPDDDDTKTLMTKTEEFIDGSLVFEENNGKIKTALHEGKKRYFILRDFTQKLNEGFLLFEIETGSLVKSAKYLLPVYWHNKPLSANNEDIIMQSLAAVEEANVLEELSTGNKEERERKLNDYWEKIDPTPGTRFNELQEEFYLRVDHAIRNFSSLSKFNGHLTDRGKIFIRYGTPSEVIRGVDKFGRITESWFYKEIYKEFIFTDRTGTNNFQLL